MSRSYRKTPITGWTTCESEKWDKKMANRKLRRRTIDAIRKREEVYPELKEVSDIWDFGKDGKQFIDANKYKREMRK